MSRLFQLSLERSGTLVDFHAWPLTLCINALLSSSDSSQSPSNLLLHTATREQFKHDLELVSSKSSVLLFDLSLQFLSSQLGSLSLEMALVLSPWFGRGCGRRTRRPFSFGSPSLFTDLVIIKIPQMQMRQASCAPGQGRSTAMSNARVVQWSETADLHIFKLRLPGLKKEDLHIQVEDDRTLYISYSNQPKEEAKAAKDVKEGKEGEAAATDAQSKEQKPGSCTFMRKFKLPENADLEEIKAEVANETLTVTVPKRKPKSPETRKIEVSDGGATATDSQATSSTTAPPEESEQPSSSEAEPSTSTA